METRDQAWLDKCRAKFQGRFKDVNIIFERFTDQQEMRNLWHSGENETTWWYKYFLLVSLLTSHSCWWWGAAQINVQQAFLWEVYGDKPEKYFDMLQRLNYLCANRPEWLTELPSMARQSTSASEKRKPPDFFYDTVWTVHEMWLPWAASTLNLSKPGGRSFINEMDVDYQKRKKTDLVFRKAVNTVKRGDFQRTDFFHWSCTMFPTMVGLNEEVFDAVHCYLQHVDKEIDEFLKNFNPDKSPKPQGHDTSDPFLPEDEVHLLFGVAGSGKTRSIERLLSTHWGFYFLACNLRPDSNSDMYKPGRMNGSSDTWTLYQTLQKFKRTYPTFTQAAASNLQHRLHFSRTLILDRFLKMSGQSDPDGPRKWYIFQTSCQHFDPFDNLFRLLVLVNDFGSLEMRFELSWVEKIWDSYDRGLYFCMDEAQCDLIEGTRGMGNEGLLEEWIMSSAIVLDGLGRFVKHGNIVIAGTSLRSSEAIKAIEAIKLYPNKFHCRKHIDFPLLTTGEDFKNLLSQHEILDATQNSEAVAAIKENSIRLRGRYRWSVKYIEGLKKLIEAKRLTPKAIQCEALETAKRAKDQLKKRLKHLHKKRQFSVLEQLCRVAIQSDLLDKPMIFEDDKDCEMISLAFAVVKPVDNQECRSQLQEQLAMEAIIEFFRDEKRDQYNKALKKFLYSQQNDASAFGRAAEPFLAWELRKCLTKSDRMTGSTEELHRRREKTLDKFGRARHLTRRRSLASEVKDFASKYYLVEGAKTSYCSHAPSSRISIWQWMASIRERKPVASFYFPDHLAGPDLIFALKKEGETEEHRCSDMVLCIVQLKTGSVSSLREAIETTSLETLYGGKDKISSEGTSELNHWRDKILLRVLVTTAMDGKRELKPDPSNRTSSKEYFVRMDKEQRMNLFGPAFDRLGAAMNKEKDFETADSFEKADELRFDKRDGKRDRERDGKRDGGKLPIRERNRKCQRACVTSQVGANNTINSDSRLR